MGVEGYRVKCECEEKGCRVSEGGRCRVGVGGEDVETWVYDTKGKCKVKYG